MSDQYGNSPQNPYGPPQPNPYGAGGGYGAPQGGFPGGGDSLPPKTDGVSIASLVVAFLCCLAPIGVILGFVGLSRTKGGKRKGRGLAIAGIVVGIIMSIISAILVAVVFFVADSIVTPGNAEVGQCVDVDEDDGTVVFTKKECTEEHDAEIVGIAEVDADNREAIETGMAAYCLEAIADDDFAKLAEYVTDIKAVIEDPDDVSNGDHLVCYVEPSEELTKPLL